MGLRPALRSRPIQPAYAARTIPGSGVAVVLDQALEAFLVAIKTGCDKELATDLLIVVLYAYPNLNNHA